MILCTTREAPPKHAAKSLQSSLTLYDPIGGSPPGSPVPGILQAGTLAWVAISFSNAWKWKVKVKSLSCVWLFTTPWTAAHQAPPSMGFSRQEYWSRVPSPSPNYPYNWYLLLPSGNEDWDHYHVLPAVCCTWWGVSSGPFLGSVRFLIEEIIDVFANDFSLFLKSCSWAIIMLI